MPRRRGHKRGGGHDGGSERWLITYADLITLLLIFFVIMYAMSKIDSTKFMTLSQSLATALHKTDEIPMNNMGSSSLIMSGSLDKGKQTQTPTMQPSQSTAQEDQQLDNLYAQVKKYIDENHLNGNVSILNEQRGVQITLRDVVLFDTGEAVIKPQARGLLSGLVPFFKKVDNNIVIEGYTDNIPISTPAYPTNWELSSARADGVVRFLQGAEIPAGQLSAVGYGEFHPIVPNDTDEHRQENRRVNIVILRKYSALMTLPNGGSTSLTIKNAIDLTGNFTTP